MFPKTYPVEVEHITNDDQAAGIRAVVDEGLQEESGRNGKSVREGAENASGVRQRTTRPISTVRLKGIV